MRILTLLTSFTFLTLAQQLISLWFLFDFFLARDSLTVDSIWKPESTRDPLLDQLHSLANQLDQNHCQGKSKPIFEKVIFIVIDALGSDFIPSIKNNGASDQVSMPFLENAIKNNEALGYMARAATPTVTMPRIKALVSGTIPSFVDIMNNLASDVSNFKEDNILSIAKSQNKSLVFYGDDTWLSLFDKSIFKRYKETFSFYANDYTTVDTNVTESAIPETMLDHIDWDYMILHYLGLDHIGHVFGSNKSPLIREKLIEMDSVVERIYENMSKKDYSTLMVICGDHGMSQEGNHGGESDLEAQTAMSFLPVNHVLNKINLIKEPVQQIDMAASLSILTGAPIPRTSRGVAIETLLHSMFSASDSSSVSCAIFNNLMILVNLTDPHDSVTQKLYHETIDLLHQSVQSRDTFMRSSQNYTNISRSVQDKLLETIATHSNPVILVVILTLIIILSLASIRRTSIRLLLPASTKIERIASVFTLLVPILMHGSTDFVELEHIFWPTYSLTTALLFIAITIRSQPLATKNLDILKVTLFFITFVITTLCNNRVNLPGNGSYRSNPFVYMLALAILCNFIRQNSDIKLFKPQLAILLGTIIMISNHTEEPSDLDQFTSVEYRAPIQQLGFILVLAHTVLNIMSGGREQSLSSLISKLASGWISLAFLLSRGHNFLFYASTIIMETSINSIANALKLSAITRTLMYVNFAQAAFFNQGNTNLFSSLDVRPAFFGQSSYNLVISVPLVMTATFSAQIYWYLKMFQRNQITGPTTLTYSMTTTQPEMPIKAISEFVNARNFLSLGYFMLVCIVLRNHLFVWSVLSPKLLYHAVSNLVLMLTTMTISCICTMKETKHTDDIMLKTLDRAF